MKKMSILVFITLMLTLTVFAQRWEHIGPVTEKFITVKVHPDFPDTIFAVQEGHSEPSHTLWVSPDRGESWERIGEYKGVSLHPSSPETLLVSLGIGSFSDGIYKSRDMGRSIEPEALTYMYFASGAYYDPTDPRCIYCWGQGLVYTRDSGILWDRPSFPSIPMNYWGVIIDPMENSNVWAWTNTGLVIHSRDYGGDWPYMEGYPDDVAPNDMAVSPIDLEYVYMANWNGISRSRDYGASWEDFRMPSQPTSCVWVSEHDPESIIFGGAYGVFKSSNGGETYDLVGDSLEYEVLDIEVIPYGGGYRIYAATSRNGIMFAETSPFSTGPMISGAWPPNGKWVSLEDFDVRIKIQDPDGVDESSIVFEVNGTAYTTADPELSFEDTVLIFTGHFDDGSNVECELISAEDALGNPSSVLPYNWLFKIDRTPPRATYINPHPDDTVSATPFLFKMHLIDERSGLKLPSFVATFNSVTVYSSCMSFLFDADTVLIDLNAAGLTLEEGLTIEVGIYAEDSVEIGDANALDDEWVFYVASAGIGYRELPLSQRLRISPNPFNAACRIETPEEYRIYDASGKLIIERKAMERKVWDGCNDIGMPVPSGIYFIQTSGGERARIILLR